MVNNEAGVRARIAVVDDEPVILESWQEALGDKYEVLLFSDPLAAQHHFDHHDVDVALLDVRMPAMDGMSLLAHLRQVQPKAEVIMVTGHGTIQTAVAAMQLGAYDFFCKPIDDLDGAVRRIDSAVEHRRLRELNATLKQRLEAYSPATHLIGESRPIRRVREIIDQIADATAPVLICGESGTGKELVARALHTRGLRRQKPFLAINCAAMTETLIDSELFGHERGAFTGATSAHKGVFEAAHGGVLFLDEIGDVPPPTQVRLLRAIQEGEIRPVGSTQSRKVDVRVVAATNVDLERAMREGRFRDDLYYRISTFRIELPALRDRREDVATIAQFLLGKLTLRSGGKATRFGDDALAMLVQCDWPGNVRELSNAVEHAATLCDGEAILPEHLPAFVLASGNPAARRVPAHAIGSVSSSPFSQARNHLLDDFEMRYLKDLLAVTEGNLSEASRRSGIDRSNLRRLLKKHSIQAYGFRG